MNVMQFIAPDAASALARIHTQLGPQAVVLSVRQLPPQGLSRLLPGQRRIEVLAGVPDDNSASAQPPPVHAYQAQVASGNRWRSVDWLCAMGLLPECANRLQSQIELRHGALQPDSVESEWAAVHEALTALWLPALSDSNEFPKRPHVFIGPPGSGKTTALCKWLTIAVLTREQSARVYRLDSDRANTADCLSIHCEMLGAPVERFWTAPLNPGELQLIDLPGVEPGDRRGLSELEAQLNALPHPQVHLVLNAAYETRILLDQLDAFAALKPHDLIFTHLDEEKRRVKLWNLLLRPERPALPVRFVSGGQKIPGDFATATPDWLLPAR